MPEAIPQPKQCPECGANVPPEKGLCRDCGYVFPVKQTASAMHAGLTENLVARAGFQSDTVFRSRLRWVLMAVLASVVMCRGLLLQPSSPPLTWEGARSRLPAPRWYDSKVANEVVEQFRKHGDAVEVRVADGQCLINYPNRMAGLSSRTIVKMQAMEAALGYCMKRDENGDSPPVTVIVFCGGEKFLSAHIKNWKPE
jgi:hypothetical protein